MGETGENRGKKITLAGIAVAALLLVLDKLWGAVGEPLATKWFVAKGVVADPEKMLHGFEAWAANIFHVSWVYAAVGILMLIIGLVAGAYFAPVLTRTWNSVNLFHPGGQMAKLSREERLLMAEILEGTEPILIKKRHGNGHVVHVGQESTGVMNDHNPERLAALAGLCEKGLLADRFNRGEVFELTAMGREVAHKQKLKHPQ